MTKSEVAAFRQEQHLREQAAHLALSGSARVADHESITARMMLGSDRILQLMEEGKQEEAVRLFNSDWC
jgi:hypothetical protein